MADRAGRHQVRLAQTGIGSLHGGVEEGQGPAHTQIYRGFARADERIDLCLQGADALLRGAEGGRTELRRKYHVVGRGRGVQPEKAAEVFLQGRHGKAGVGLCGAGIRLVRAAKHVNKRQGEQRSAGGNRGFVIAAGEQFDATLLRDIWADPGGPDHHVQRRIDDVEFIRKRRTQIDLTIIGDDRNLDVALRVFGQHPFHKEPGRRLQVSNRIGRNCRGKVHGVRDVERQHNLQIAEGFPCGGADADLIDDRVLQEEAFHFERSRRGDGFFAPCLGFKACDRRLEAVLFEAVVKDVARGQCLALRGSVQNADIEDGLRYGPGVFDTDGVHGQCADQNDSSHNDQGERQKTPTLGPKKPHTEQPPTVNHLLPQKVHTPKIRASPSYRWSTEGLSPQSERCCRPSPRCPRNRRWTG